MSGSDLRAPFPWFGGKARAADLIWSALGDPGGYVEPFAGSAAVLLARPGWRPDGWRRVETLNDADGWLVNTWRAIRLSPEETASHCYGPVSEIDYHARLAWLQSRRDDSLVSWLEGDPEAHDPKAAGWWLYVVACGIGDPFGPGPWRVEDGRLVKLGDAGRGINRELPHLGNAGQGINRELQRLSLRLERVRITCGDWRRVLTPSVTRPTAGGDGSVGILLDPPYSTGTDLYAATEPGADLSGDVRDWCIKDAPPDARIVLCGYSDEHDELLAHGWTSTAGRAGGGAGYAKDPLSGRRERLWMSPACIHHEQGRLL